MSAVSNNTTLIVSWTLGAVATVCTGVRYALRGFVLRNWYWDDLFHGITFVLLITLLAAFTAGRPILEAVTDPRNRASIAEKFRSEQQLNISVTVVSFTAFWSTKLAFLFFYRLLFRVSRGFLRAWWIVLILTVLTYWVVIAGTLTQCNGSASNLLDLKECNSKSALSYQRKTFIISYTLNIASDLAIMSVPLFYLSTLQLSIRKKLGIAVVFCFASVIIAFESLRFGESVNHSGSSNNALWILIETDLCVLVSSLPTLSALKTWKKNGYRPSPSYGYPLQNRTAAISNPSNHQHSRSRVETEGSHRNEVSHIELARDRVWN